MDDHAIARRGMLGGLGLSGLLALAGGSLAFGQETAQSLPGDPFTLFRQKVFVPVRINGADATGFLDTGADELLLDPDFAARAGVVGVRNIISSGWGSDGPAREADDVLLRIGGQTVTGPATLRDMTGLRRSIGRPFDAIIGRTLFDQFVTTLDFDGRWFALDPPQTFMAPADAVRLALTRSTTQLAAPITLEGQGPIQAGLDLGSAIELVVRHDVAKRIGLFDGRAVSSLAMNTLGGSIIRPVTTAGAFAVGPFALPDVPCVIFDDLPREAVLGMPVLMRFQQWLDFGRRQMWLKPDAQAPRLFDKDRVGLFTTVEDDGGFRIIHVAPGSPAEAAGFKVGERLAAVNGQALPDLNAIDPPPPLEGVALTYNLASGGARSLVTRDYY